MGLFSRLFGKNDGFTGEERAGLKRMEADHQDLNKARVWCVLGISYSVDPGYLVEHSTMAIRDWYGIRSSEELIGRVQDYLQPGSANMAYDAFRAAFLARAGAAAGTFSDEQSWAMAQQAVAEVQGTFASWAEFGQAYTRGHMDYRAGQGDSPERLAEVHAHRVRKAQELANGIWATIPLR